MASFGFIKLLTQNHLMLMDVLYEKDLDSRTQQVYTRFGFFMNIKALEDFGFVKVSRIDDRKRKLWTLTDKGKKIMDIFREVDLLWEQNL